MAHCIRSLTTRSTLLKRRHHPSFTYILHQRDDSTEINDPPHPQGRSTPLGNRYNSSPAFGFHWNVIGSFAYATSSFNRHMSTGVGGGGRTSDGSEILSDAANVLTDHTVNQTAAAVSEVAAAAADSYYPVAVLQHFIDAVHTYTGLGWWASIALMALLIRTVTLPLSIKQLKATRRFTLMRPHLDKIREEMEDKGMDPKAIDEGKKKMTSLFKEYGVTPFTPLTGLLVQGPIFISFYFAISNMVEKVPSFKSGGAYWFVDLTTPDNLYIFPVLTALSILATVEFNMQEGLEGNPIAGKMKKYFRVFAIAAAPMTMGFPKAIFCYWITSNFFSLMYGTALKIPGVKKFLCVPEIPDAPENTTTQSSFNPFTALKQDAAGRQDPAPTSSVETSPKLSDQRVSSSDVLSQRLRSLEQQVKGRKQNEEK